MVLRQQNGPGQESSASDGNAMRYNHGTGEAEIDKPGALQMIDKGGIRPKAPPKPVAPPPKRFRKLIKQSRNSTERRGMTGGK